MAIFDATQAGSPVTADQFNFLVDEIGRVLRENPSTASFSYLGEVGTTTATKVATKVATEFSTSLTVPVPSVVANCDATCNVILGPILFSGADELSLTRDVLSWRILGRAAEGTVGTYSTETLPTSWNNIAGGMGAINAVSVPVTFGSSSSNKFTGALVALRLAGTWGYSGDIPGFVAFCSY